MASGNSSVRVGNVRGVPEVRELSAAFDQMADSVSTEALQRRDMAADLAHELRAPIAVLQAGLEAMQDGLAEPTPENLDSLRDEVVRLAQMTDDLRVLASGHEADLKVELATHDLAAIAAETADSLASSFEAANVSLELQLAPVNVLADARRIHEVAVNLLSNAVKFTPAGGKVTLETGPAVNAQFAMLRVSDTGIGIPAEELPYVTQRFFRGKRAAEVSGSGIGLAIVDQIARLHHGRMLIVSEPARGTQVTVMLPRGRTDSMKAPHLGHQDCISTGFPPSMDTGGYLVMLEELWRQKVDQIVVLSMAYHDDVPADTVHALTSRQSRTDTVLMNRVMRAHEDLALIEDAIDRIKEARTASAAAARSPSARNG